MRDEGVILDLEKNIVCYNCGDGFHGQRRSYWPLIKNFLSKGGQNIVYPSRNSFIAEILSLESSAKHHLLYPSLHFCFPSELRNSVKIP